MTSSFLRTFAALVLLVCFTACATTPPVPRQVLYLSCKEGKHVLVYDIDATSGRLNESQRLELPGAVGPIALTDDGQMFYAALRGPDRILSMKRDPKTGLLELGQASEVPAFPTYLDIDSTGKFAIAASYGVGQVYTFKINDDRSIHGDPIQTTNTDRTAHASLIDPSNRFVYIPHTVPNAIYQFRFDANEGKIRPIQPLVVKGGGTAEKPAGPRHYIYHPTLGIVYAVNELGSSVSAYQWDRKTGKLTRFQTLSTLPALFKQRNTCADIHITPDGRFLYASNRGHDTIAAYRLDDQGLMTFIDWFETEPVPREFAIDLTGSYLYSAGLRSDKLVAYSIDERTGRLQKLATYDTPGGPIWVEAAELK